MGGETAGEIAYVSPYQGSIDQFRVFLVEG